MTDSKVVVGIDLSFTSTGMVAMVDGVVRFVQNIKTTGKKGDTYYDQRARMGYIDNAIRGNWLDIEERFGHIDLNVLEAPSFGSGPGGSQRLQQLGGLWWKVFDSLVDLSLAPGKVITIAPTTRAKYIAGSGRADKAQVLEEARKNYGDMIENHDIADAAGLAAMGSRYLGTPAEPSISKQQQDAFEGVSWPRPLS